MAGFVYVARDQAGRSQTGYLDGANEDEVIGMLQSRGLIVTSLTRKDQQAAQASGASRRVRRLRSRVSGEDKVLFCQQLATLLDASVPLLKSLEVISAQVESKPLLLAVERMRQDIEAGQTFRDAMASHPKLFSSLWVNLVETGEASGHLAQSLHQLSRYLESTQEIQRKAVTALTYPIVLIIASLLAVLVFMLKIIPIFSGMFASMHVELPMLTKIILGMSVFVRRYFLLLMAGVVGAVWASRRFLQTEAGRWLLDRVALKVPVFNQLFIKLQLAQFARGLSTLLESGVPILFGLQIMENSASNKVYGRAIGQLKEAVREGKAMAGPLDQSGLFPAMMVQMVRVGEEIGELGKMLDRVAKYYEEGVATFVERLTVLFEPIAIAVMAVVVGVLVISMFLPIFKLTNVH